MKLLIMIVSISLLSCSHQKTYWLDSDKIKGEKEISIESESHGTPWLSEIEMRLKSKGISIKRSAAVGVRTEKNHDHDLAYSQSATRYILRINGRDNPANRCFAGGFTFINLSAELYDSRENKTIVNITDDGYSEGCAPAYGNMFQNIADQVFLAWE